MSENNNSWDLLAQSIADGEAVLVLGPDAIPMYPAGNGFDIVESSFSKLSRQRIIKALDGQINLFYQRDNLFQFNNAVSKQQAMKEVRNLARDKSWVPDQELLRQIVAIPFPLVLNINPEKFLYDAYVEYYHIPQFDYFTTKDKPNPPTLEYPDGYNRPMLYNLCGSIQDKLDSIVLDYYDLFELLKNVMIDNGISNAFIRKLQDADRFILLGFELDRWYFQLFLHYLNKLDSNPFNNSKQNFPIFSHISEDACTFVMKQFNIQYIAPQREDFEKLFQACEKLGILRQLHESSSPLETQIRKLVVQGKYEETFRLVKTIDLNTVYFDEILHIQSRYIAWQNAKSQGTVASGDLDVELNRIRYNLLTMAAQLRK